MFYLKRGESVVGPYDEATIRNWFDSQRLKPNDLLSESPNGPWLLLAQSGIVGSPLAPVRGQVNYVGKAGQQQKELARKRAAAKPNAKQRTKDTLYIGGSIAAVLLFFAIVGGGVAFMFLAAPPPANPFASEGSVSSAGSDVVSTLYEASPGRSTGGSTQPSGLLGGLTGSETKRVKLGTGTATFTIKRSGPHHLRVDFNNGLVAKVDWKENPYSDFGYDIYEPEVSETTNRLALMIMLRGIIANYLKGEYD